MNGSIQTPHLKNRSEGNFIELFKKFWGFALIVGMGLVICIFGFVVSLQLKTNEQENTFQDTAQTNFFLAQELLEKNRQQLESFRNFYDSIEYVREMDFRKFSRSLLQKDFEAIIWATEKGVGVQRKIVSQFTAAAQTLNPLDYSRLNFSSSELIEILTEAEESGRIVAGLPGNYFINQKLKGKLILAVPIYFPNYTNSKVVQPPKRKLKGFLIAILRLESFFETVFHVQKETKEIAAFIFDNTNSQQPILLGTIGDLVPTKSKQWVEEEIKKNVVFYASHTLMAYGRRWDIVVVPTERYLAGTSNIGPWAVLLSGLLALSFLGSFLFFLIRQKEDIERIVDIRTSELVSQQQLQELILESLENGVIVCNLEGKIILWNKSARILAGLSSVDISPDHWPSSASIVYPESISKTSVKPLTNMALDGDFVEETEIFIKGHRIDTQDRRVLVSARSILDSEKISHGAVIIFRDITEKANALDMIATSGIEIARLAAIVESSSDAITSKSLDGTITSWNPAAEKLYGYKAEEIIGTSASRLISPCQPDEMPEILEKIRQGKRIDHYETVRVKKGGKEIQISMTISPIKNAAGVIVGASTISRDIGERVKTQHALEEKARQLSESNLELEKFAYVASHDLQEPLRTVSSFGTLIQDDYAKFLPAEGREYIEFMVDAARRMQRLIDDLLVYSRVGTQGKPFVLTDFNHIADTAIKNLTAAIELNSAEISVEYLPTLWVDGDQFVQLFQNLLANAIKFKADRPPKIHVSARKTKDGWEFCVEDNGIGIESKYFDRIFEIFQRLHTIQEYSGSGIGLGVCKKIAERHGGRIWAESVVGHGSKFFFTVTTENVEEEVRYESSKQSYYFSARSSQLQKETR